MPQNTSHIIDILVPFLVEDPFSNKNCSFHRLTKLRTEKKPFPRSTNGTIDEKRSSTMSSSVCASHRFQVRIFFLSLNIDITHRTCDLCQHFSYQTNFFGWHRFFQTPETPRKHRKYSKACMFNITIKNNLRNCLQQRF